MIEDELGPCRAEDDRLSTQGCDDEDKAWRLNLRLGEVLRLGPHLCYSIVFKNDRKRLKKS